MSISRRNAITGAAAVAVAAIPVTVQANDAHLEALYTEWQEAEATWLKVNAVADNAHLDALRACGDGPDRGAAYKAAVERYGYSELKRKADVASATESDALHRFIEAPASTEERRLPAVSREWLSETLMVGLGALPTSPRP